LYLCDKCDCAGFWEVNIRDAAFRTGIPEADIGGLLDQLGEKIVRNCRFLWLKNFLFHQRNLPLSSANKAHRAIIARLHEFMHFSDGVKRILDECTSAEGASKGLPSPPGNSNSNSNGNGKKNRGVGEGFATEFEAWWTGEDGEPAYPKRVNKKKAKEEYISARKNGRATKEELAIGKRHYNQKILADKTDEQYIAYPSTWLHQERWHDYQEAPKPSVRASDSADQVAEQVEQYRLCKSRARACATDIALERERDELSEEDRQKIAALDAARVEHEERAARIAEWLRERGIVADEKVRHK